MRPVKLLTCASFPHRVTLACAGLLTALLGARSASAATIVNDHWTDGTRGDPAAPVYSENGTDTDLDGDVESAWVTSNPTGVTMTPGHFTQATVTGSTSWESYFRPEAAPVTLNATGDFVKVTWVFTPAGVANDGTGNTGQNFRVGVVDTPSANRLGAGGADGSPAAPVGGNYNGYATFMNMDQTLRRSTPFQLFERTAGTAALLGTGADWVALANNGANNDPGYVSGNTYTYTLTLTRNAASGLDIVSRMEGTGLGAGNQGFLQVSFTDTTPNSFTYDTFAVRPSGSATSATSFDQSQFKVDVLETPLAPEPASLALAGAALLTALRRRR